MSANANPPVCEVDRPASKSAEALETYCGSEAACPVLILAPYGSDARLTADFLASAGLATVICENMHDLFAKADVDCGALLIAEEAIDQEAAKLLTELFGEQPSWSDIPVAVITTGRESSLSRRQPMSVFGPSGNVTLIERPFRPRTLVSTMEVALRSRRRQFLVRDLLRQNAQKSHELMEQTVALREADRRKNEFLAMLAHELRNPLASISSAVSLLKETQDHENRAWAADVIDRQGCQLARLVDDLLDVSRITRGKIDLRRELLDGAYCLGSACEAVGPMIVARDQTLVADIPYNVLWLEADPTRLEQIAVNLLANAAKYTRAGGHLWIEARREGEEIVIEVRDSGIGMMPKKIPEMFELFAQGERSAARSEGGLGIGLTVVRALCELHEGSVSARSEGPGRGSTFTVRLPAAAAPGPSPAIEESPASVADGGGTRILVVDDNLDSAQGLARLLSRRNYEVRLAQDGFSAIKTAKAFLPSAILLDIGLPEMDGYEVARRLRMEPICAKAMIIAVSGYGQEEDRKRSRQAGFDYHLVKPVNIDQVRKLIVRRQ
jgi:signal transduction histidine kinase